jgi:hypothetical protein
MYKVHYIANKENREYVEDKETINEARDYAELLVKDGSFRGVYVSRVKGGELVYFENFSLEMQEEAANIEQEEEEMKWRGH